LILALAASTSLIAYQATKWNHQRGLSEMRAAAWALFEWAGIFSLFLAANLALGILVVFLIRTFTLRFVALYAVENVLLVVLSGIQAFMFHYWWKRA
jgi:hypothetical protein